MSKTVAVISDSGFLTDAFGRNKESTSRYSSFANRLVGADGTTAVINYGWNGASNLNISKSGGIGQLITLNAETVVVPGNLKVGGVLLKTLIDSCTDLAINGIKGTESEIDVTITENSSSAIAAGQPRLSCVVSLDPEITNRISTIEQTLTDLFRFEEVYTLGDGLTVLRGSKNELTAKLGTGLKFEEDSSSDSEDDTAAIALDFDTTPTAGSKKPVTSGGIYDALHGGLITEYYVCLDSTTGNMALYHNT